VYPLPGRGLSPSRGGGKAVCVLRTMHMKDNSGNPYQEGNYVWWHDELWQVQDTRRHLCLIHDIGDNVSNITREWVHWHELELADEYDPNLEDMDEFEGDDLP
jgi:hypothetical protein